MSRTFTVAEVAKHNKPNDIWIIVLGKVYDVSSFDHPGGKKLLLSVAGKDASEQFTQMHNVQEVLEKYGPKLYIGDIASGKIEKQQEPAQEESLNRKKKYSNLAFGELVPFGDPNWYQDFHSPYYNESHRK
jgi:cytochrome b involved in lipid metabolism